MTTKPGSANSARRRSGADMMLSFQAGCVRPCQLPTLNGTCFAAGVAAPSIRPDHLEHVFVLDLEIIALAAGADDRAGEPGPVDAVTDHRLVDMNGDHFAERQPGLRLFAVGALQMDDLRQPALERHRALRNARH